MNTRRAKEEALESRLFKATSRTRNHSIQLETHRTQSWNRIAWCIASTTPFRPGSPGWHASAAQSLANKLNWKSKTTPHKLYTQEKKWSQRRRWVKKFKPTEADLSWNAQVGSNWPHKWRRFFWINQLFSTHWPRVFIRWNTRSYRKFFKTQRFSNSSLDPNRLSEIPTKFV